MLANSEDAEGETPAICHGHICNYFLPGLVGLIMDDGTSCILRVARAQV